MTPAEYGAYCRTFFGGCYAPDYRIEVPCGHCHSCERDRMRSYQIRLLYELDKYPNSFFVTLTFDNDNLSQFRDNPNKAIRLFLDRCRKFFGKQIRHWFVAEYGSLRGRLHYHGIIFNSGLDFNSDNLLRLWTYGFVWLGYANDHTARYICKYVCKSVSRDYSAPPRIISSKGIGSSYINEHTMRFHVTDGVLRPYIQYGSCKVPLPRYYYSKVFRDSDKHQMLLDRWLNPTTEYYCNGKKYNNYHSFVSARKALYARNCYSKLSFSRPKKIDNFKQIIQNWYA